MNIEDYFREKVKAFFQRFNYVVKENNGILSIETPEKIDRDFIRKIHLRTLRKMYRQIKKEDIDLLKEYMASPDEIDIDNIFPKLVLVDSKKYELSHIFRAVKKFWGVPVTSGYGRRINILIFDKSNEKLIGAIGLCDPVFNMKVRDEWIGWDTSIKKLRLWHVLNAYILGAVPPYSMVLGGKLVSLVAVSNEVRHFFEEKYKDKVSSILKIRRPPYLVMLITTAAYGKSIMLDRLHNNGHYYWKLIGFTSGYAAIAFDTEIYSLAKRVLSTYKDPELKKFRFGDGPNFKMRILRKAFEYAKIDQKALNIGIRRGVYVAELSSNARAYLKGLTDTPKFWGKSYSIENLMNYFYNRWIIPRKSKLKEKLVGGVS